MTRARSLPTGRRDARAGRERADVQGRGGVEGTWNETTRRLVEAALREDIGKGDLTSARLVPRGARGAAHILARTSGVLAGVGVAERVFRLVDPALEVRPSLADGARFQAGERLLEIRGSVASILTAERTALNFLGRLCGIATLTRAFVEAVTGTGASILDTRKTTPGWRELERAAVRAGGGLNHRFGLCDAILIKENHVKMAGGVAAAWRRATKRSAGRASGGEAPAFVEIEVRDLKELEEALGAGARHVLLDNFSPGDLGAAVRRGRALAPDAVLEASGGIDLANVREVAETGVDRISVGALTHAAPSADLSLLLEDLELDSVRRSPGPA